MVLPLGAAGPVVDLSDVPGGHLEEVAAAFLRCLVTACVAGANECLRAVEGAGGEVPVPVVLPGRDPRYTDLRRVYTA